ncbi:response regulator [Nodosilinea sp. PGN35]|uniref:response regulator n=1 Tax=Nodosilinea sp. PGN35 TaxID=3020489 RepID=UPI0023B2F75E|nr:response regulator [Nodosilinea sp. TSF1-S3]MDF0368015.1 response regulator [Nodosilinea sp. TSF1-S3]
MAITGPKPAPGDDPMQDLERDRFILVIDPNPAHGQVVQRVLGQRSGRDGRSDPSHNHLEIVVDGKAAIDYLRQRGEYAQAPRPDLVLLDLELPGLEPPAGELSEYDGYTILTTIKTTPHLRRIPVIVFTESDRSEDILRSYASQSNCYVVKAADLEQLSRTVQQIEAFWLGIVTLPLR